MENPQIELARRYVEQTGVSLFLTGKAGTGKTTFLHDIDEHCPKRHVVVAPTGVAAVNAGGVTIHSFFQLPFDPYLPDVKELVTEYQVPGSHKAFSKNKLNVIRSLELLVIDEISMVRADLLDAIDMTLRRVRRSGRPFGGVQLLMVGDVHQLPPVVTERERPYMEQVYPSPFFFHSKALQRISYVTIELATVYRQQDVRFVDLLNRVRNNNIDAATLETLNARVGSPQPDAITLTTHNHQADAINRTHMLSLNGERRVFEAVVTGNYPDSMMPIDRSLEVKEGERVMYIKNDSSGGHRYYNGKLGTVTAFCDGDEGTTIEVTDDDGDTVAVGLEQWDNIKYNLNPRSGNIEQVVEGSFRQYPLRPAWAVTIHKAQGLTFDRVSVNAADAFAFGQVYVALSRCRSLEGLTLTTPLTPAVAFSDVDVQHFCEAQPPFEQVAGAVEAAEEQYYHEQLADLFSLDALVADLEHTLEVYGKLKNIYPKELKAFTALADNAAQLASVSERFRVQLAGLPREAHAERIAKGSAYYLQQLTVLQTALGPLLNVEVDNKETDRQLRDAATALRERLKVKLACLKTVEKNGFKLSEVQKAKVKNIKETKEDKPSRRPRAVEKEVQAPVQPALAEMLRRWRKRKAEELGVSAFVIFDQRTLMAIASAMPSDEESLRRLPGIGHSRMENYGKEILDLVADYRNLYGV